MHQFIYLRGIFYLKKNDIINNKTKIFIMPRERSIDIDDKFDLYLVKHLLKNEKNYLNKFKLNNKKAYVVGGSGLLVKK